MIKRLILIFCAMIITNLVVAQTELQQYSSSNTNTEKVQEYSDEPYYFIHAFHGVHAEFLGGCAKALQSLNNIKAQQRIHEPTLKKAIAYHLNTDQEFTAMTFKIENQTIYATIFDQVFHKRYCRSDILKPLKVSINGFQVDIQNVNQYQQQVIITKVKAID